MVAAPLPTVTVSSLEIVERYAREHRLFRGARAVMAAVSGGPDSVALLLLLEQLSKAFNFTLTAVHFDHMLRPDSGEDLAWVASLCEARGIAFLSGEGDVAGMARQQRRGVEETARRMRYQFLAFVAGEKQIDTVATGHTADDQAETVLMHVIRGSGVRGIRGMRPIATIPGGSQRLVRPLLPLARAQTQALCEAAGITPRVDPSNADQSFQRNRVRAELVPLLQTYNPSVREALVSLGGAAASVFDRVEREAMLVQPSARLPIGAIFDRGALAALGAEGHLLVVEREAAFYRTAVSSNRTVLHDLGQVLGHRGHGRVRLGATEVEASGPVVRIGPCLLPPDVEARVLNVPGVTAVPPYRVRVLTAEPAGAPAVAVDGAALAGALRARAPRPGDRMRRHGHDRKLSDIFQREGIPAWDRRLALVFADSERVHAVMCGPRALAADLPPGSDPWYVAVEALPGR